MNILISELWRVWMLRKIFGVTCIAIAISILLLSIISDVIRWDEKFSNGLLNYAVDTLNTFWGYALVLGIILIWDDLISYMLRKGK
ncbi:hypothetical protein ACQCWA_22610 [Rossellomorea aquimaris]|uniref:hypothetical protein n=2 Tax=Bacillales TaxID=1385 RepID=UPI0011EE74B7